MKIRNKLLLLLTLGVLVPVLLSHFFTARASMSSMNEMIRRDLAATAGALAGRIDDRIRWLVDGVGLVVESVPFDRFEDEERSAALSIPYRQLADATIVALFDDAGKAVAAPYRPSDGDAALLGRQAVPDLDLDIFSRNVPIDLALGANVAIGPVHRSASGDPRMVLAAAFPVAGTERRWVLAVQLTIGPICGLVAGAGEGGIGARLVDQRGLSLCEPPTGPLGEPEPIGEEELEELRRADPKAVHEAIGAGGVGVLRAVDEIGLTGWRLAIDVPQSAAMAPVARSLRMTAVWIIVAIVIALSGGIILARGISRPITELEEASRRVAGGDYSRTITLSSGDEVGSLAAAFNRMTEEIRAWNAELVERVEARTRELKEAQEQILLTQRMAAVGELGAGVAHEINNPLTAVVGLAQLMRAEVAAGSEAADSLDGIVSNAKRVAQIVEELLRYSQSQVAADMQPLDVMEVLRTAAWLFENRFREGGIEVLWEGGQGCMVNAVEADLRAAFNHLLDNALKAMPGGGKLTLSVGKVEGQAVKTVIRDEGVGMSEEVRARAMDPFFTTAAPGSGSRGLGLAAVHRVVGQHGGRIVIESQLEAGTTATIYLPGRVRLSKS